MKVTTPKYQLAVCISCRTILEADEMDAHCPSRAFARRSEDFYAAGVDIDRHLRKVGLE